MMALLNLSVVFTGLVLTGAAAPALAGSRWIDALIVLVAGLVLAREPSLLHAGRGRTALLACAHAGISVQE